MDFSVSMSVYAKDNPQHFRAAMQSIFEQTVRPAEVILVVDGPVDDPMEAVIIDMQAAHETLRVIRLNENKGHGEARRTGLANCTCELVAIMDSDDISVPDRFEKQVACFEEDCQLSALGGQISEFEGDVDNVIGIRTVPLEDGQIKEYLRTRCPMNQMTVMFRRSHADRAGGYLDWHHEEDYYLWIRMVLAGCRFRNLPETLVYVRMNADSYLRRGGLKYFRSEAALQLYMYKSKVIGPWRLVCNLILRLIVQVMIPNRLRRWMFANLFRTKKG